MSEDLQPALTPKSNGEFKEQEGKRLELIQRFEEAFKVREVAYLEMKMAEDQLRTAKLKFSDAELELYDATLGYYREIIGSGDEDNIPEHELIITVTKHISNIRMGR